MFEYFTGRAKFLKKMSGTLGASRCLCAGWHA